MGRLDIGCGAGVGGSRYRVEPGLSMKVVLRNPRREIELTGIKRVGDLFRRLDLVSESYLPIRAGELCTIEDAVDDEDVIELRPVISGG